MAFGASFSFFVSIKFMFLFLLFLLHRFFQKNLALLVIHTWHLIFLLCTTAFSLHFLYVNFFIIIIGDLNYKKIIRKKWFLKKIHSELKSKKDVLKKNGNIYYMTDEKKGFL